MSRTASQALARSEEMHHGIPDLLWARCDGCLRIFPRPRQTGLLRLDQIRCCSYCRLQSVVEVRVPGLPDIVKGLRGIRWRGVERAMVAVPTWAVFDTIERVRSTGLHLRYAMGERGRGVGYVRPIRGAD